MLIFFLFCSVCLVVNFPEGIDGKAALKVYSSTSFTSLEKLNQNLGIWIKHGRTDGQQTEAESDMNVRVQVLLYTIQCRHLFFVQNRIWTRIFCRKCWNCWIARASLLTSARIAMHLPVHGELSGCTWRVEWLYMESWLAASKGSLKPQRLWGLRWIWILEERTRGYESSGSYCYVGVLYFFYFLF